MKTINNSIKIKKILIIFFIIISFYNPKNEAKAQLITSDMINNVMSQVNHVLSTINQVKTIVNTAKSAVTLAKNLSNFDLSNIASNLSAATIQQVGDTVIKSLGTNTDKMTNVFTNGKQVVTDYSGFVKSNGQNAIRSVLNEQIANSDSNPYIAGASKNIIKDLKNQDNNQITISLPYIAQNEICNDNKLKDIIKHGEKDVWIKPKPALKNVDIDKLCNADLTTDKNSQASFIAIAKAGYGGPKTNIALADPANTPSAVADQLQAQINTKKASAEKSASDQLVSNGGLIGDQKCLDANGNVKSFDSSDPNKAYCSSFASSVEHSAAVIKSNINAASQSPYFDMLAKAQSSGCGDGKDSSGKANSSTSFSGQSEAACKAAQTVNNLMNMVNSIIGEKDGKPLSNDKYAQMSESLNKISSLAGNSSALADTAAQSDKNYALGAAATATADMIPQTIDTYEQIRKVNTDKLNSEVYTYALLESAIGYSGEIGLNFKESLVKYLATDATPVDTTIVFNVFAGSHGSSCSFWSCETTTNWDLVNSRLAAIDYSTAITRLGNEIRNVINQMAYNNYKEQQLKKLEAMFKNSGARPEDNTAAIAAALSGVATQDDLLKISTDWNYAPEFLSTKRSPTMDDESSELFKPDQIEINPPFTRLFISRLRLRAYHYITYSYKKDSCGIFNGPLRIKLFKNQECPLPKSYSDIPTFVASDLGCSYTKWGWNSILTGSPAIIPDWSSQDCQNKADAWLAEAEKNQDQSLLDQFNIKSMNKFVPDLPVDNYPAKIVSDDSEKYSELAYCNKAGLGLCNTTKFTVTPSQLNNTAWLLAHPQNTLMTDYQTNVQKICTNPRVEIKNFCAIATSTNATSTAAAYCATDASTTELLNQFMSLNCN